MKEKICLIGSGRSDAKCSTQIVQRHFCLSFLSLESLLYMSAHFSFLLTSHWQTGINIWLRPIRDLDAHWVGNCPLQAITSVFDDVVCELKSFLRTQISIANRWNSVPLNQSQLKQRMLLLPIKLTSIF